MKLEIEKGTLSDIEELARLYDALNDYLACHTNHPGWKKGIYPTRDTAVAGIEEDNLFVARANGKIVGTVILRHQPEEAYALANWPTNWDYSEIFVVHTVAVHPDHWGMHIGKQLMDFVLAHAEQAGMKALRLDVYEKNLPAIRLYESCGFEYVDTVDLGYRQYGLDLFRLYERTVESRCVHPYLSVNKPPLPL